LWKRRPHHAAKIKEFSPERFVGWLQDELQRYNDHRAAEAAAAVPPAEWLSFTLHDFRRTANTGMQMAGVTEKEASVMVGATPEAMRRHYEKLDQLAIAKRNVQRRLGAGSNSTVRLTNSKSDVALLSREESKQVV
jgi:integrase